jgi:hypothetical protein
MKRKRFLAAMFGAALVFGILIGAASMDAHSPGPEPADDPAAKSVSITDLEPAYDSKWLVLYLGTGDYNLAAGGMARISGDGSATVPLKTLSGYNVTQNDWTGSGSFTVYCRIFETENDTTDISRRIVTGDIPALTISDPVTVIDAAEKLIFQDPFDNPNALYDDQCCALR